MSHLEPLLSARHKGHEDEWSMALILYKYHSLRGVSNADRYGPYSVTGPECMLSKLNRMSKLWWVVGKREILYGAVLTGLPRFLPSPGL